MQSKKHQTIVYSVVCTDICTKRGTLGLVVYGLGLFLPRFSGVLDFEVRFCGFLQHRRSWLLVLIVGSLWFADVDHSFSVAL